MASLTNRVSRDFKCSPFDRGWTVREFRDNLLGHYRTNRGFGSGLFDHDRTVTEFIDGPHEHKRVG